MKDILEPLSQCGLLAAIRREALSMAAAEAVSEEPGADLLVAELAYDEAAARLLGLIVLAEETGLMDEIAGYLAATYGG